MASKVREENIPLISYIEEVHDGDISDDQDVQRSFCSDDSFINGIAVTILTGDYLPPLVLAEVPLIGDVVQKYVADGLQRTAAIMQILYGNHRFKGKIEDSKIEYQTKELGKDGRPIRDEEGKFVWVKKIFDITGKTFADFPDELKRQFKNFQMKFATYTNYTMEKVSKLIRKLNNHKGMNASQKALTWIPTYARRVKVIANGPFFKNSIDYSDNARKNGEYLQSVCRSVMTVFHFDDYKRGPKELCYYLEDNGNMEEFNTINDYFNRIEVVCGEAYKEFFGKKDIPVWAVVFDKFTKFGKKDEEFARFMAELQKNLHSKEVDGMSWDSLNKEAGTTDKKLITNKVNTYMALMKEFLQIQDPIEQEENTFEDANTEVIEAAPEEETVLDFVKANVDDGVTEADIDEYYELIDYCKDKLKGFNKSSKLLDWQNEKALVGIIAYAMKEDIDLDQWLVWYSNQNNTYVDDMKENYLHMMSSLNDFVAKKVEVA